MARCWCGSADLKGFAQGYSRCLSCGTLVADASFHAVEVKIDEDEEAFYGKEYWFSHQEKNLGLPDIHARARSDLPERCLYWLRTLLKYKPPPAAAFELGGAHGGFVAMLRWAGYDASGVELSPWVVGFARETFGVPMYRGPVEDQDIEQESLDVIVLMDVIEHLPNPLGTMKRCTGLLKPDGIFLIQTPCYRDQRTYDEMVAGNDPFLNMLIADEHLYLFSRESIIRFLHRLGMDAPAFEPAVFAQHDMFIVAGRGLLRVHTREEQESALLATPGGRMVLACLDLDDGKRSLEERCGEIEADRAARLAIIQKLERQLRESEADRVARLAIIQELEQQLRESEADRAARLAITQELERQLRESEADRAARLEVIGKLEEIIRRLEQQLGESEADRAARLQVIRGLSDEIDSMKASLGWRMTRPLRALQRLLRRGR